MCTHSSAALFVVFLGAVVAAAQTERPHVTVIGCIQRSEPPIGETTDTTIVDADQTQYVLTKITLAERGTPPTDPVTALITENVNLYRLDDSTDGVVAPHVGDRVAITGTVIGSKTGGIATAGKRDERLPAVNAPVLKVQSVRTIAAGASACAQ